MSTTEVLLTRLDAMQTELYKLQVENRRQQEEKPEQAQLLEVEEELAQTREENVRLAQQISEWSRSAEDEDMSGEQEQKWKETIARLEDEVSVGLVPNAAGRVACCTGSHDCQKDGGGAEHQLCYGETLPCSGTRRIGAATSDR